MDKIGFEGVAKELEEAGFAKESVEKYLKMFEEIHPGYRRRRVLP